MYISTWANISSSCLESRFNFIQCSTASNISVKTKYNEQLWHFFYPKQKLSNKSSVVFSRYSICHVNWLSWVFASNSIKASGHQKKPLALANKLYKFPWPGSNNMCVGCKVLDCSQTSGKMKHTLHQTPQTWKLNILLVHTTSCCQHHFIVKLKLGLWHDSILKMSSCKMQQRSFEAKSNDHKKSELSEQFYIDVC